MMYLLIASYIISTIIFIIISLECLDIVRDFESYYLTQLLFLLLLTFGLLFYLLGVVKGFSIF